LNRDEIFATVRDIVAGSLALRPEDIGRESRLIDELGANSLDFLEIVFALEKRFGIDIREGDLAVLGGFDVSAPGVIQDGFLSPNALEKFAGLLPECRALPDPVHVTPAQLFSLLTVETLCAVVEKETNR